VVGYIIYSVYNELEYERFAKENRPALKYIEKLYFIKDEDERRRYQDQFRCFLQKKEFLDLIYHTTSTKNNLKIRPEILQTLKNHLSNFAARRISGLWVPIFSFLFSVLTAIILLGIFDVSFTIRLPYTIVMFLVILIISFVLLYGHKRVLREAYILEGYMIRAKCEEIEELLEKLFPLKPNKH